MPPQAALDALQDALDHGETAITVADVDWSVFGPALQSVRTLPFLSGIPEAGQPAAVQRRSAAERDGLLDRLAALPDEHERQAAMLAFVRAQVAATLRHESAQEVPADGAFHELGFTSLTAVELRSYLEAGTGVRLPPTLVFDYPTPAALTKHLLERLGAREEPPSLTVALDRLSTCLASARADDAERAAVTARLRTMLDRWVAGHHPDGAGVPNGGLDNASDEEVFELLGREFGIRGPDLPASGTLPGQEHEA